MRIFVFSFNQIPYSSTDLDASLQFSLVLWVCTPLFGHGKTMVISKRYWTLLWFLCLVAVSVLTTQKYYYLKEFTEQWSQPPELIGVLSSPTHHGNATATAAISTSTSTATAEAETDNVFAPGSLTGMTRLETYERCYVDPARYQSHFGIPNNNVCSLSEQHKLVFRLVPKTGSSTARAILKEPFDTKEVACEAFTKQKHHNHSFDDGSWMRFASIRDPTPRLYSSFHEFMWRWLQQKQNKQESNKKERTNKKKHNKANNDALSSIPSAYRGFLMPFVDPTTNSSNGGRRRRSSSSSSLQSFFANVTLVQETFEEFLRAYDGRIAFDTHFRLQTAALANRTTGRTFPLDKIWDLNTEMMDGFRHLVVTRTKELQQKQEEEEEEEEEEDEQSLESSSLEKNQRRSYHRFIRNLLPKQLQQKNCQLAALDYCCLKPYQMADCIKIKLF